MRSKTKGLCWTVCGHDRASVVRSAVASVSYPKLSRTRSTLLAGGVVAVALGLARALGGGSVVGSTGGGGGGSGK